MDDAEDDGDHDHDDDDHWMTMVQIMTQKNDAMLPCPLRFGP
jgi:hypothetical protein